MLKHLNNSKTLPSRIIVLGAKGFVGSAVVKRLAKAKANVVALSRHELNLLDPDAAKKLAELLKPEDALVITSAKAPCKDYAMLRENIDMMFPVCEALSKQPVSQVIYISSDAVYADSDHPLTESSLAAPTSLHGVMHLAREMMLQSVVPETSLALLRPSLLYGAADPHNGYGPNRFYRLAAAKKTIPLFGNGEERRDHVYIHDVAELVYLCLSHQSHGVLNIATGEAISFYDIARQMNSLFDSAVEIQPQPRSGPMPHNGYRPFSAAACKKAFPEFSYTTFEQGLLKMHEDYQKENIYA